MLSNAPVSPTLAVNDLERARRFYEEKLGFEVEAQVAETVRYRCGNGTGLAIFERPMTPIDRTVAAFEVEDIETEVARSEEQGRRGRRRHHAGQRCAPGVFQRPRRQHHRHAADLIGSWKAARLTE